MPRQVKRHWSPGAPGGVGWRDDLEYRREQAEQYRDLREREVILREAGVWKRQAANRALQEGTSLVGRVIRVEDTFAIIKGAEGWEGLLHISQISEDFVTNIHDHLAEGKPVVVWVLQVDRVKARVCLTRRYSQIPLREELPKQEPPKTTEPPAPEPEGPKPATPPPTKQAAPVPTRSAREAVAEQLEARRKK
jgi:predicted RNA-binding protein with RPS1 domain